MIVIEKKEKTCKFASFSVKSIDFCMFIAYNNNVLKDNTSLLSDDMRPYAHSVGAFFISYLLFYVPFYDFYIALLDL